jgi:hypothetical protein
VPNLIADRGFRVAGLLAGGNVRRLMYQSLIWSFYLGDDARRLRAPLDPEDRERLADALVDGVRRNLELGSDFLGGKMLVDEEQAVQLAGGELGDARRHQLRRARTMGIEGRILRSVTIIQGNSHPAQHAALPS